MWVGRGGPGGALVGTCKHIHLMFSRKYRLVPRGPADPSTYPKYLRSSGKQVMAARLLGKEDTEFLPGLNRNGFYRVARRSRTT